MKLTVQVARISSEVSLATLILEEKGKVPNIRQFVVTDQQLAFLQIVATNFQKETHT